MKPLLTLFFLLGISLLGFSQNSGLVIGKIFDGEVDDVPMVLANVAVKGSDISVQTDITGMFVIENLADGHYTLVCSFVGYETQEVNVKIVSGDTPEINLHLNASTISLADLAALEEHKVEDDEKVATIH